MQFQVSDQAMVHGEGNGVGPGNMGNIWDYGHGKILHSKENE